MADWLQKVTKLALLNHYLDSGSIALMNRNENEEEKAGQGVWPPCQALLATRAGPGFAEARSPLPPRRGCAGHHLTGRVLCLN